MRRWVLRAKELRDLGEDLPMNDRCRRILGSKSMLLFSEMLSASGYGDQQICKDIAGGFELLGTMPRSGVMPEKTVVASVSIDELRQVAHLNQRATWAAVADSGRKSESKVVLEEIYRLTQEECAKGWMRGPYKLGDIPCDSALTPRFGVTQSSSDATKGTVTKVRPIDNFTASLANMTNSGSETILPHGVDLVVAALVYRVRKLKRLGKDAQLLARTVDLRKAYKQLPLSDNALRDSYICVFNPGTGEPEIYQCLVLPFGAKPSVMGFCRTSLALWWLGVKVFWFHWTVYFDDFVLVCSALESKHLDLLQNAFFCLMGWETSAEKDVGFSTVARALGVEIDLAECRLNLVTVCNTEARKKSLSDCITNIIQSGGAQARDFESLRGRLNFAEGQIFGRGANLRMRALAKACKRAGFVKVSGDLLEALLYLRDRVVLDEPRRVTTAKRMCYHLYTDASLEGGVSGLGGILFNASQLVINWFAETVGAGLLETINPDGKEGFIYEMEVCAAVQGVCRLCASLRSADIVLFCDNEAALAALIACKSDSPFVTTQLSQLCNLEAALDLNIWFERVPSASNPADEPSRMKLGALAASSRVRWSPEVPAQQPPCFDGGLREHFACWKSCWTNLTCWTTLCDAGLKPAVKLRLRVPPRSKKRECEC